MELKELHEQLSAGFEELKATAEKGAEEIKKQGEEHAETKQTVDRIQDQLDKIEVRFDKVALDSKDTGGKSVELKAWLKWARRGEKADFDEDELKSLAISPDTAGGYLVPDDFLPDLLKGVIEYSPLRRFARIYETSTQSVKVSKRTGTFAATWVADQGTRSETTGLSYGLEEVPTHELYALSDVSNQLLEDSRFNLEEQLGGEFSEQFGVAEGSAFVNGTGVGRPEGFIQNSSVSTVTSTTNDVLSADDFFNLLYQLKEPYHVNAAWLLNRLTVRDARKLKDSQNRYLWEPALTADAPALILGHPYAMATDMAVIADASKSVAVGDWKRGYLIVDRVVLTVLRDPLTQATSGNTRFIARKRVGGQVVVPEAIKILVTA